MAEAEREKLRIVFLGTPEFAVKVLEHVLAWPGGVVAGVITQPDRPSGRGRKPRPPAVKQYALEHGLPVHQPENFNSAENVELVRSLRPDVLLTAAYGVILPQEVLDIPRLLPMNVHASLLPKYRGAAPIQRALLNGETVTGVTIMRMIKQMDAGPILLQRALGIGFYDTAGSLHDELADMGGRMAVLALERLKSGALLEIAQDPALATYAPQLKKQDGLVDWDNQAMAVHNHIRAVTPWPGAHFFWSREQDKKPLRIIVYPGEPGPDLEEDIAPGAFLGLYDKKLGIACKNRMYLVPRLRPQGKKEMDAEAFYCGYLSRCEQ